jgi:hypothetical protein
MNPDSEFVWLCWVCEEKVTRPEWFLDSKATQRVVHDWCIAGAVTKDRRQYMEGG